MDTHSLNSSVRVKYAIVHITRSRVRIRIPKLKYDREYQCRLKKLVDSFNFVTGVRVNPAAQSLVVYYDQWALTFVSLQKKLAIAIQQAADINIDVSVSTSVQGMPSLPNGASKERFSLQKKATSRFNNTCSSFVHSKEKSTELHSVESVSSVASQPQVCKPLTMEEMTALKAANLKPPQKVAVKKSDLSIEANGFSTSLKLPTLDRQTSLSNTEKRFRIVFLQTRATARPIRSSRQEKIVDYKQMSQQLQTIQRAGGKILSISVIS
ncbi:hypothetical protein IQ238_23465 [Pleurocapsales cyanobacterium LEGE 06147]|nr:hypothetical protein [Pleurocapsales cyanobacterium LEGE 06147]